LHHNSSPSLCTELFLINCCFIYDKLSYNRINSRVISLYITKFQQSSDCLHED
jgi:hypothetical protein